MSHHNKGSSSRSNCKSCQCNNNTDHKINDNDYNYSTFNNKTRFQYDQHSCGPCRPCYSLTCREPIVESCKCAACNFCYDQLENDHGNKNHRNKNHRKCGC